MNFQILKEFKEFAMKGNVMDMAVGIIIGAAFGKIVSSLVGDIIMPPIGVLLGGSEFKDLVIIIQKATEVVPATATTPEIAAVPEVAIRYGVFLQTILDFLIVAISIFAMVKTINKMSHIRFHRMKAEAAAAATTEPLKADAPKN